MLHARNDYNERVQDSKGIIPDDEPVFLLRAKDQLMLPMLAFYLQLLRTDPKHDVNTETGVLRHILRVGEWQHEHGAKMPDCEFKDLL